MCSPKEYDSAILVLNWVWFLHSWYGYMYVFKKNLFFIIFDKTINKALKKAGLWYFNIGLN